MIGSVGTPYAVASSTPSSHQNYDRSLCWLENSCATASDDHASIMTNHLSGGCVLAIPILAHAQYIVGHPKIVSVGLGEILRRRMTCLTCDVHVTSYMLRHLYVLHSSKPQ